MKQYAVTHPNGDEHTIDAERHVFNKETGHHFFYASMPMVEGEDKREYLVANLMDVKVKCTKRKA